MLPLQAGIVTLAVFGGLTVAVFVSGQGLLLPRADPAASASFLALGVIIAAVIGGFSLGLVFCAVMVALMSGVHHLRHVEHHPPLRHQRARGREHGPVRLGRAALLLHPPHVHGGTE